MKENLQTKFLTRQFMLSKDFEIYYYNDNYLSKVESHAHCFYELYFFIEGDVSINIEGNQYPLKYGDVVLIPPGIKHNAIIHSQNKSYRRFVFWISKEYYDKLLSTSNSYGYIIQHMAKTREYIIHNDCITFNSIQSKVFQLIEESNSKRFGREAKMRICADDIIFGLNRICYERNNFNSSKAEKSLYEKLIDYIEDNLEKDLSLENLAKEFFVSKYYIAHMFKDSTGLSIHNYIIKKRLKACKDSILGEVGIGEVYFKFGFKDYSSFYRAFKKEYGISPKEYKDIKMQKFKYK